MFLHYCVEQSFLVRKWVYYQTTLTYRCLVNNLTVPVNKGSKINLTVDQKDGSILLEETYKKDFDLLSGLTRDEGCIFKKRYNFYITIN